MESATSPSANMNRHPWAIWELVFSAPRWLLHRGYPPELDDPRLSVRLWRITIVTFLLGFLAGWAYAGLRLFVGYSGLRAYVPGIISVCYSGLCFGLIVLVPLSRWQGRNWWWTAAAVPISGVVHHLLFSPPIPWLLKQPREVIRVIAATIGACWAASWMNPPINRRALAFILLTMTVGVAGYFGSDLLYHWVGRFESSNQRGALHFWIETRLLPPLQDANSFWPFNSLVAMVLGWESATRPRDHE